MLELSHKFMVEREKVRIQKAAGLPKPWTDWELLLKFRFTNVRRMDDKVSVWLYDNWYHPHFNHPNMLLAVVMARQLNSIETLAEIGFPLTFEPEHIEKTLRDRAARGLRNFSAAYMITGTLGGDKTTQLVHKVLSPLVDVQSKLDVSSMERSVTTLLPHAGMGTFIAGQVVADLRWALEGEWLDKDTWAPLGPGSNRWLRVLNGETEQRDTTLKGSEFLKRLLAFQTALCEYEDIRSIQEDRKLELMDWQNVCCESFKCWRWLYTGKSPKQNYPGTDPVAEDSKPFWEV